MRYFTPASSATGFLLGKLTRTKNEMVTSSSETKMKMKSTAETRYIKPAQVRSGSEKNSPRFADVLSSALRKADESTSANLGEFFSLPLLTCAGLMYLVSAVDFIFIFVSLELVTISFFVL